MTDETTDDNEAKGLESKETRRKVLATMAGITIGSGIGYYTGADSAVGATTAGSSIANRTTPAEAIYADRLQLVDNNQSLSNNGDFRYNP